MKNLTEKQIEKLNDRAIECSRPEGFEGFDSLSYLKISGETNIFINGNDGDGWKSETIYADDKKFNPEYLRDYYVRKIAALYQK